LTLNHFSIFQFGIKNRLDVLHFIGWSLIQKRPFIAKIQIKENKQKLPK